MTNVEALKLLYANLGGDEDDVADINTNADMIAAIAEVVTTAIGSALPKVTAADNGKVLKVVDGEWAVGADLTE